MEIVEALIYDFETLSQDPQKGVVVNMAAMNFTEDRYLPDPYTYDELVDNANLIKFDVKEQVEKYGRRIEKNSLDWWKEQPAEAKKQLNPSSEDVSIDQLCNFMLVDMKYEQMQKVFTRGNSFDPVLLDNIFLETGCRKPNNWWAIRDTRSFIEGFTYGTDIRHDFHPQEIQDKFVTHDARHDIAMDVYRMQYLVRNLYGQD